MVVIAIIGILASIAIVNIGRNPDRDVRLEADRLVTFLRDVQNKALATDKAGLALGSDEKLCGFGIYGTFGEADSLQSYYVNTKEINYGDPPITISGLDQDCASLAGNTGRLYGDDFFVKNDVKINLGTNFLFLIPNGDVYIDDGSERVTINLTKSGVTVPVYIEETGRIY